MLPVVGPLMLAADVPVKVTVPVPGVKVPVAAFVQLPAIVAWAPVAQKHEYGSPLRNEPSQTYAAVSIEAGATADLGQAHYDALAARSDWADVLASGRLVVVPS